MINNLPNALFFKSLLIGSPFERLAKQIQQHFTVRRWRWQHPELTEIFLENDRATIALSRLLKKNSNCVDVGCHIGSFLSSVIRLCPDGEHTAIEASLKKSAWLKKKFPTVDIRDVAVAHEKGIATFYEDPELPGFSRLDKSTSDFAVAYEVQVLPLDDLLAEKTRIDLIKIDIEGGELNALRGARETIRSHAPILYFECASDQILQQISISRRDIYDLLTESFNYQIYTLPDFLYDKGPLSFDEFRKCGLYPYRAFNFLGLPPKLSCVPSN